MAYITRLLEEHEQAVAPRQRARKKAVQGHYKIAIEVTVANLARVVLKLPQTGRLAVNTSVSIRGMTRYDNRALGKLLRPLLDALEALDLVERGYGAAVSRWKSSIAPTTKFAKLVQDAEISPLDFRRLPQEEVLFLERKVVQKRVWWKPKPETVRAHINYRDTSQTEALRNDVKRINAYLEQADITFVDDGLWPRVDPYTRTLRRVFVLFADDRTQRFDRGGRLVGGFWQPLRSERRRNIRINGEPATELDFGSMITRLAYAERGARAPDGDLYAIPELAARRAGVRFAMDTLLFDNRPTRRTWPEDVREELPRGWTVRKTKAVILKRHPFLEKVWDSAFGYTLMYRESEVMIAVLKELAARSIPSLPIHDALMLPASQREVGRKVMEEQALRLTGVDIPVAEMA